MIRGLWLRTHREILHHCGNNCLWLQRNPPVPLCPVYQSEHLRHPAQLSCGKSRLSLVHSLPQTVTPRPRSITTQQQETDYLILILLTNATCLHLTPILQSSFINYLMKHVTIYATDSSFNIWLERVRASELEVPHHTWTGVWVLTCRRLHCRPWSLCEWHSSDSSYASCSSSPDNTTQLHLIPSQLTQYKLNQRQYF